MAESQRLCHKMIGEKRGLSTIVATVFLIFLTISVIVIITNLIVPFVEDSLDETSCVEFRGYFKFDESFDLNCYADTVNADGNRDYKISVAAGPDNSNADKVIGFDLGFFREGSAVTVKGRLEDKNDKLKMLESMASFEIPVSGGEYSVLSYVYSAADDNGKKFGQAKIYPVLKGGRVCEESDSIQLTQCS